MGLLLWMLAVLGALGAAVVLWVRRKLATAEPVGPQPPLVAGLSSSFSFLANPTRFLNSARRRLGADVFVLDLFGLRLFFVFSPAALAQFYRVPETDASFAEATKSFLGVKYALLSALENVPGSSLSPQGSVQIVFFFPLLFF